MISRAPAALALCAALAACATGPTLYGPATGPATAGYSQQRIEADRFRVTFRGGPGAPAQQVADYALLRAADIALAEGFDWFRVYGRWTEAAPDSGPRVSVGTGSSSFGRSSSFGVGVGTSFSLGGGPRLSQTIEVVMGKGPVPRAPDVYDARQVREAIGPRAI